MARVTVEDCLLKVPSRFELVLIAAQRARALSTGAVPALERDNDKNAVVALREIAAGFADPAELREARINRMRTRIDIDTPAEDPELMAEVAGDVASYQEAPAEASDAGLEEVDLTQADAGEDIAL